MELEGFLLLDKPPKIASSEATALISKLVGKKCGHIGTLDPNVSGVLPIAIGRSRKLIQFLDRETKEYVGILKLSEEVPRERIERVFRAFTGEITQMPPKISAVARRNRKRKVYSLDIVEIQGKKVLFIANVEAGTYIRVLCEDIGKALGIKGRMDELRRTAFGNWRESQCITIDNFIECLAKGETPAALLPPEKALPGKVVEIKKEAIKPIKDGMPLFFSSIVSSEPFKAGDLLKVMFGGSLVGMALAVASYGKESEEPAKKREAAKFLRVHI
ncbi:MAG: hypothetical protein QW035_00565 [Candidatus Anstonellales archaeon]